MPLEKLVDALSAAVGQGGTKRAVQLEAWVSSLPPHLRSPITTVSDSQLTSDIHNSSFGQAGQLFLGKIVYSLPFLHCYRVQLDKSQGDVLCCRATATPLTPLAVRDTSPLPSNSIVIVYRFPGAAYGIILGVVPDLVLDKRVMLPDWIEQGGNNGFKREQYYYGLMSKCADNAGLLNFASGRPLDATALGEWGLINDLGMGYFLDNFTAFMRVDEASGLWMYYLDRLVRLAAYNFDLQTAGSELIARDDEGEFQHYEGFTPYPWEALGLFAAGTVGFRTHTDAQVQYEVPYGKHEPLYDDQQPFYRYEEHKGYLGQASMRQVLLPPQFTGVNRYSATAPPIGVFREQIGLDGSYSLTSAHSISFSKRIIIPVPKRKRLAEAAENGADTASDHSYKPASVNGTGPDHKIRSDIRVEGDLPHIRTATAVQEQQAHLHNWKVLHPFFYHQGDFETPEEHEHPYATALQRIPDLPNLGTKQFLDRPDPVSMPVDHRMGATDYYETSAGVHVLPDGSVVIRDGYGSEIVMTGGSIFMRAAGDIWRQSGRSCVDWAGDDHILKAHNSIDITASNKDVRLKAENNLEMLAGNSGRGRMLLENRAVATSHQYEGCIGEEIVDGSGIILRSPYTQVVGMAREIYLRTGSSDGGISSGNIVIDADKGNGRIHTICSMFDRKITGWARDAFFNGTKVVACNSYAPSLTMLDTPLYVDGTILNTKGGMYVNGWIIIGDGHIASQYSETYNGMFSVLKDKYLVDYLDAVSKARKDISDAGTSAENDYKTLVEQRLYQAGQIGNGTVQKNCSFSLRNEEQYNTEEFKLPEAYWQHMLAQSGAASAWTEQPVQYQNQALMPYPGYNAWQQDEAFLQVQPTLHNTQAGLDVPRTENEYGEPVMADWQTSTLSQSYLVISV
jgi:hypothetical protein